MVYYSLSFPHIVHYEKVFQFCQSKFQGEGPTGVLLVYPQHCLHLMEGPWELINAVLADLHSMDSKGSVHFLILI